ncbi:TPA: hypothetical protein SFT37_002847 [Staphylococcus aureus]|nr:hypothetical protein [Staphylococcus aureus]HEG7695313.1 hypothetical protein [Staphylococcus aureus]
MSTVHYQPNKK